MAANINKAVVLGAKEIIKGVGEGMLVFIFEFRINYWEVRNGNFNL